MATGLSLLGLDDKEENPLFLSKEEALSTEVLPRSRGFEPAPRTALTVPTASAAPVPAAEGRMSLASILDAKLSAPVPQTTADVAAPTGGEKRQSLSSILDSKFGMTVPSTEPVPAVKPVDEAGDTTRGFTTALEQTPALAYGALGLAGAAGEKAFGEGGSMSALKKFGLSEYQTRMKEIGAKAKDTDDVTNAWAKAKQGDLGALVDWAQYGVGYLGGNIVETVATSALGGMVGGMAAGPAAPAGAVAGVAAGAVGKEAVKGIAKNLIEGMVAKEAARLAEKAGVETATDVMLKEATKNVAKNIGAGTALAGSSLIKETGGIYGEAEEQAAKEGRQLSGGDLARIFGSGVVAGLSEFATDKLGLDVAAGKISIPGGGRTGRALIGGAAGVGLEGGTELFQTAVERFGAGKSLTGEDAMNEYINAFALGGLGGGTVGTVVGAFREGKTSADRVRQILDQAKADMTSDDGRQELFDAMSNDEKIGPILQANNIESGDDPRFQDVIIKALATQRMLVDLEAPTPEVRAETRKQREADILAAFGETASTAVGGDTGAIEPVIQRASVTPNLETRTLEGVAQPVILPETTGGQAGTVALSPEDLVARQEGFEPLVGIKTEAGPVGNRFPSIQAAETFLLGPVDKKTGKRNGGYAQTVLAGQGLEARIRQGKRSKAEGGGTFFFVETRKKPAEVVPAAVPEVTAAAPAAPVVTPAAPAAPAGKQTKPKKGKAAVPTAPIEQVQPTQGEANATQTGQVTEGGQPKREDTGGGLQTVGENRNIPPQEQTGGGETGGGNQPVEGGAQPQEVAPAKPAVDPALQARVKERINKAYEESGLDLEDVVKLNKMVDDGDLAGAVSQMKKTVEDNLGAGTGTRFSMGKEQQTTTTKRDFSYAKLKTVEDLNNEVRSYLKRQGSTATFTAKRVPLGDIVGKVPGISAVQRVAALFGKKPVYFAVEAGGINDFDGAVLMGSDTIFINVNSSRPHIRIFGHELVHSLRASNNSTYRRLVNSLTPLLDQAGMLDYAMVMSKEGVKDPAIILEEAIGDIVGDRFGESAFWQMLADDNPTMFQQVARIVMDFIDNALAKLRGDQSLGSKNLVTDLNAARRVIADVLGNIQPPTQEVVAQPEAGIQFSTKKEPAETFYSAMERGFESVKQSSMPAQQWKAWLNSNKSKLGIKNAEIEWTGIEEWLDLQEGKVEKQDILNWIAGNRVKLNDIILNAKSGLTDDQMYDYVAAMGEDPDSMTRDDMVNAIVEHYGWRRSRVEGTKHRQYTEPGGDDSTYTEIVLVDPTAMPYKINDKIHFGVESKGQAIGWIRSIVRKDVDGNDVLFLEEIQSQRGQEGRDVGFITEAEAKEYENLSARTLKELLPAADADRYAELKKKADMVPSAPFVEDTKAWTSLLLKRAIAFAQTQGINRIAWTTGEQQVERYKLSKSIDELLITKNENGTFNVLAKKNNSEVINQSSLTEKELTKAVGKGLSTKAMDSGEELRLVGEEMDIGGEGVSYYYNTTVPSVAKTIVGKDAVSVMDLEDTGEQLGFVIPENLQEQVATDGFPMFSRRRYEEQFSDLDDKTKDAALRKGYYTPPTIKERLDHLKPRFWDRIVQGTFDKFRAVRGISEKAYMMLRLSAGSQDGAVSTLLHYGQVFDDDGALNVKKGTKGLLDVLKPVGGEVDRFLLWIAANRAANLSKDERERFFKPEDIRMLQKLNMGTMKDGSSRIGVYAEALKNMNELNRSVLDVARSTGLIDADAYKRFSADIWYVPFYRQMEDDGSLSAAQTSSGAVGQYLSKKLKGSDRPLNDLMENVLMNWTHILSASMKNKAAVETLKAASDMGDIVTKLPAQMKGAVKVMENGKETYYQIDDEFLMNSLTAVAQAPSYGFWMDTARGFKTTLTRFISLSPTFKINNLIRDSIQSIGLSELSRNPMGNVLQGWRAYKDDRAEALAGGGLFAMGNAFDGDQSAAVKRLLKTGVNKADILDTKEKAAAFFASVQDKYDELSDASENANRLALYQQLRAKGASHLEASYAARDLQDFSLQGSYSAIRYAAQVLPYFNARLQGMYKLGRDGLDPTMQVLTGKASDTERQKAAKFATVTGAVVAAAMILYLSQKDDEDWKKREDWDRDAFFWFKLPGTDKAVRIPKPFEMGAIATLFERVTEQMVDSQVEGKVFGKRLLHVLSDNFAINPIPQAVRPIYDIARNKDGFTDRPIESMGMERVSVENRVSPGTSGAAVAIGTINSMFAEFASKVTGGAINSQSVQLSPIQYDYMIKGYLGWVGTGIQTASNVMATPFKDGASSRYERIDDYLVVGNFVKTVPQSQSRYVTSFYENAKDIATASADVSHFLNAGQFEKANEIYLAKADKLALAKLYNKGTNMMSSISNQIKMVEDDKVMTGAQKRLEIERLQQIRIQIAKDVEDVRISSKKK